MIILSRTLRTATLTACGLVWMAVPALAAGARVTAIEGTVQQRTVTRTSWHACLPQAELQPGEAIRTGRESRAELTLVDGVTTRLAPTTSLSIGSAGESSRLKLLLGKLYMKVTKRPAALHVETVSMTAAIMGTEFLASVNDENVSHVTVFAGQVDVTGSQGDKVTVHPGEWVEVEPNKPVGQPSAFGMVQLRQTEPLLRDMGTGLGVASEDDIWR